MLREERLNLTKHKATNQQRRLAPFWTGPLTYPLKITSLEDFVFNSRFAFAQQLVKSICANEIKP